MFIEKYYSVVCSIATRSDSEKEYERDVREYEGIKKNPRSSARNEEWAEAVVDADNLALNLCQDITDPDERMEYFKKARFVFRAKRKDSPEYRNQLKQELSTIDQCDSVRKSYIEEFFNYIDLEEKYAESKAEADSIRNRMRRIEGLAELEGIESNIKQLEKEQKRLGVFRKKEKKELQDRIDTLKNQLSSYDYVTKAQEELNTELQDANRKVITFKHKIDEINSIGLSFTNKTKQN